MSAFLPRCRAIAAGVLVGSVLLGAPGATASAAPYKTAPAVERAASGGPAAETKGRKNQQAGRKGRKNTHVGYKGRKNRR